jgi:hypothetical protein
MAAGLLYLPAVAAAHPLVDRGQRLFEEAEFQGALEAYSQAEQASDLTREDLVRLYQQRALVHHAMGNEAELENDVFRLATLEPRLQLGNDVPPAVRQTFEAAKERVTDALRVVGNAETMPGGVRVTARIENDLSALVQTIRVSTRVGDGEWRTAEAANVEVPAPAGARVQYYAEAIGPGGALVAWSGSRSDPRIAGGAEAGAGGEPVGPVDGGGGGVPVWVFIAGGVAVVVGVVVIVLLTSSGASDQSDVTVGGVEGWLR